MRYLSVLVLLGVMAGVSGQAAAPFAPAPRADWSPRLAEDLARRGVTLLAPQCGKKEDKGRSRCLSRARWKVEGVNG